jgi:hypothetical protein
MKEKIIRMLADKKGMNKPDLFVRFFMRRFPDESDRIHSYCEEWIDRFMSGNPIGYMDNESKKIYLEELDIVFKKHIWRS